MRAIGRVKVLENIDINNKSYKDNGTEFFLADNRIQRAIKELGLGLAEVSVYLFYIRCQNNRQQARPTMEYIMKETPIKSKDTVRKAIRNLERVGLLVQLEKGHSGKASVYQVKYAYYREQEEPQTATESIKHVEDIKPLPKKKQQPQGKLFTSRGKHESIVTSKEAKERLAEVQGVDWATKLEDEACVLDRI